MERPLRQRLVCVDSTKTHTRHQDKLPVTSVEHATDNEDTMKHHTYQRKSLTARAVELAARDEVSTEARALVAAIASKAEGASSPLVKLSSTEALRLAGLKRRRFVAARDELAALDWINVIIEKRRATAFELRVESMNLGTPDVPRSSHLGTPGVLSSGTVETESDLGTPDVPRSPNHLGTPDVPRWFRDEIEAVHQMYLDRLPILVHQMYLDGVAGEQRLGTPDVPRSNHLGTPDVPRSVPSCARATAATAIIKKESGSTREARDVFDRELIREATIAKVTADTLDRWILEACARFGRTIGIGAAAGLASDLLRKIGSADLVRDYVSERLIEHDAGSADKRSGDKGFTSYLMRDATRWIGERNKRAATQHQPRDWNANGFVTVSDDDGDDELNFD